MQNLRKDAIRGGAAKLGSQVASMVLRLGSVMILARILTPNDFGLVAMVMAPMGALNIFRDLGLSTAAIQRDTLTEDQKSTLFWLNLAVGFALTCIVLLSAPLFVSFYRDPRLLELTIVMSSGFLLYAASIQHSAMLQREMRFVRLATIDTLSLFLGIVIAIAMAAGGAGYWAIAAMTLAPAVLYAVFIWLSSGWVPGLPKRNAGVLSMVKTGGIVTANGLIVYIAYNLDKVLLGRFFGADALGIYSRAYQLINIPNDALNAAVGNVAMSTFSRVREDGERLRKYFLRSYSILVAITTPITFMCAFFAEEIVFVMLGPKWSEAAAIFRYMSPTVIVFGMINPTWPLLVALGLFKRSFKLSLVIGPVSILGYCVGMLWGIEGAAIGFSAALTTWAIPHLAWTVRGTVVTVSDVLRQVYPALLSAAVGTLAAAAVHHWVLAPYGPLLRLFGGAGTLLLVYAVFLLFVMGHWAGYREILQSLTGRGGTDKPAVADAAPSSTPVAG